MVNLFRHAVAYSALILTGVSYAPRAEAQQTIIGDLAVIGSACIGVTCPSDFVSGFQTLQLQDDDPTILFNDTSTAGSFPKNDWRVGVVSDQFVIQNVTSDQTVFSVSANGNAVAIGPDATLVDGAISVGSAGNLRRVTNVAPAVDSSDAVILSQVSGLVANIAPQIAVATAQLQMNSQNIAALETRVSQVGSMSSALSSLQVNPRGDGDHFFSMGLGYYDGEVAAAAGSFHFFDGNRVFVNTGTATALSGGPASFRLGITLGN